MRPVRRCTPHVLAIREGSVGPNKDRGSSDVRWRSPKTRRAPRWLLWLATIAVRGVPQMCLRSPQHDGDSVKPWRFLRVRRVRRQGLEPRTVALRVLVRGFLDLRRFIDVGSDLGIWLPLLSAADPRLPVVRGPSAAHTRARGGHGRRLRRSSEPGGDGHQLGRWARPVRGHHEPRWQVSRRERGSSSAPLRRLPRRRNGGSRRAWPARWRVGPGR
jgi:hypothetical protein